MWREGKEKEGGGERDGEGKLEIKNLRENVSEYKCGEEEGEEKSKSGKLRREGKRG